MNHKKKSPVTVLLSFLLLLFLFLSAAAFCVKPLCSDLVSSAYLGRAFALRINDTINAYFPEMNPDTALSLQEMVEDHSQVKSIAAAYLDSLAAVSPGQSQYSWEKPDVSDNLTRLNEDLQNALEEKLQIQLSYQEREQLSSDLQLRESAALSRINDLYYLGLQEPTGFLLKLYRIMSSIPFQVLLCLLTVLVLFLFWPLHRDIAACFSPIGKCFLTAGICIGVLLPAAFYGISLPLTNRVLGRSMYLNLTCFFIAGGVLFLIGISLLLVRRIYVHNAKNIRIS